MTEALTPGTAAPERWRDPALPVADRVADLLSRMTPEEKAGQLAGFWAMPAGPGEPVAPMEDDSHETAPALDDLLPHGLGQLTRVFGTAPVPVAEGAARLRDLQRRVAAANRFGVPAIAHEECLNGFMTWGATVFPSPPAWGATFDPELVGEMAAAIGTGMRAAGVHQGLAPVLDVVRDARWGRTEECIGEDPQLVAVLGTAYVRGLERSGVAATPKHFAGYSASRAGRNMAPTPIGPRELADVILEPFVMALREGGARSIMHSYTDVDGVPAAADARLLTDLLRGELGFTGAVVSDYFGISFLESRHRVAGSRGEAGALALRAGIDVELPTVRCYGEPLLERVRAGDVPAELLDRAAARVLTLKAGLGLLDPPSGPGAIPDGAAPEDEGTRAPGTTRDGAARIVTAPGNDAAAPSPLSGDGVPHVPTVPRDVSHPPMVSGEGVPHAQWVPGDGGVQSPALSGDGPPHVPTVPRDVSHSPTVSGDGGVRGPAASDDGPDGAGAGGAGGLDLDPPGHRALARRLAEESVVLLANDGTLPLAPARRVALTGPLADDPAAMLGCYTFPAHVGRHHPELPLGVDVPTLADALRAELPDLTTAPSADVLVTGADIDAAVAAARDADVAVVALGDRAGLFGRGTSGEGCDAETLALPGRQRDLADAVLATGTPTVIVMLSGRPYAIEDVAGRAAAVVQAFFPGEEGGGAVAGVLTGRVEPSGRMPISVPRRASGPPVTYLRSKMDGPHDWSAVSPAPLFPFGHGLTWTRFAYADLRVDERAPTDGTVEVGAVVRNVGDRAGTEVVQLYLADPVASVVRPSRWLAGWARVRLEPGAAARVRFTVHADRTSFTGADLRRIVEPGEIEVMVGGSSEDLPLRGAFTLDGPVRAPGADRVLTVPAEVTPR
ncbi:beta-glucosidase family protein [Actinomadura algeriensis]|uniref:Beta-xylosidase n=1 Tax=Actinomadura algeriensis TaxID=1679523 RepID=A0ABR9K2V1_9ACTN|nr:glycoside hydrolase family 3 N-terminal domain-containing protein [Actinomadura algeriensis]MBE1537152.1 beta-xylosidase [Actinomadura algeriensis]